MMGLAYLRALLMASAAAFADDPKPSAPAPLLTPAQSIDRALAEAWPDRPEWLDMFTDIIQGSQLGPNDGWFRRALAQTRFGWKPALKRFDHDADDTIARAEFPGSDDDFRRLDRNHDGALTGDDFDFSPHALTPSPGAMLFYRTDRDGNGKVTRDEIEAFFKQLDRDDQGFLALADLQEAFRTPSPSPSVAASAKANIPAGPSKETLIRGLFRQEIGSLQPGPALDEKAPDFTLQTLDAARNVTLSTLVGPKPVVLLFGNFTCGPRRGSEA
jgi:hypothetical protein